MFLCVTEFIAYTLKVTSNNEYKYAIKYIFSVFSFPKFCFWHRMVTTESQKLDVLLSYLVKDQKES